MIPSVILLADFGPSMISSTVSIFVPIAEDAPSTEEATPGGEFGRLR